MLMSPQEVHISADMLLLGTFLENVPFFSVLSEGNELPR